MTFSLVRLGDVAEIQLGKMLSPRARAGKRPIPYLRNANVQWGHFDLTDVYEMDFDELEESKFALKPGDLLVCEGGEPGRTAIWEGEIDRCCYQKALHRVRPRADLLDPTFLLYRFMHGSYIREFEGSHAKTTIAHLPAVRLAQLPLRLPPVDEQRRIAARLTAHLAAVERTSSSLVRERGACDDLIESALRWSLSGPVLETRLESGLAEVIRGVGSGWSSYPVYGSTRNGIAPAKEAVGKNPERYKPVEPGTIFYNPMRILIGSVSHLGEGRPPGITSPDYVVMRTRPELLDDLWFYEWLRSWRGEALIRSLARGAVRERMLFRRLAPATIAVPPIARQREAAKIIGQATYLRIKVDDQLDKAKRLPRSILTTAFQNST